MVSQAQINKYGLPFVTNYTKDRTGGESQNWDGVQDYRGILYFANQNGVLEFDGHFWNRISVNNQGVSSLAVDEMGIVHVGMYNDFGCLYPKSNGEFEFVSSRTAFPDSLNIGDITKIYCFNGTTYYCTNYYVFIENANEIKLIEIPFDGGFWAYAVGDSILISRTDDIFYVLYNDTITSLDIPYSGGCYGLVPFKENKYLTLDNKSVQILNLKTLKSDSVHNVILRNCVEDGLAYSLQKFNNDNVFTFIGGDNCLVVADEDLKIRTVLNKQYGLPNDEVTNSFQAGYMLWATTSDGLSKIELSSPFAKIGSQMGLNGMINDVIEYDGDLYVTTNLGIFYLDNVDGVAEAKLIKDKSDKIAYSFIEYVSPKSGKTKLLVSTNAGIFEIDGKTHGLRDWLPGEDVNLLYQSKTHPENIYFSNNNDELYKLVYDRYANKWEKCEMDFKGWCISINEDRNGNIWFSLNTQSLVKYSQASGEFTNFVENDESELPSLAQLMISNVNDTLRFCSEDGIYEFDESRSKFVLSDLLGAYGQDSTHSYWNVEPYGNGYAVVNYNENIQSYWISYVYDANDKKDVLCTPFNRLPNELFNVAYADSKGNLWLSAGNTLYCYREDLIDKEHPYYNEPFNAHVRKVFVNDSIVLFGGAFKTEEGSITKSQGENDIPVLSYKNNSLLFQYSATFFDEEDKMVYSTMLEGADNTWSKYKQGNEYARYGLREGNYTFKVKAKNIYGIESSVAEYSFVIRPPFYRTVVAYIFYIIALIAVVFGIVKWNTHRLIEDKKKLERKIAEATEEIRGQNVQLEQQKDEIEKQKDEIQASINYARRIQRALLTPDETIDAIFPDHFLLYKPRNIVSGDYYWIGQFGDNKVCIVADCTGHGVPGGFMSMLGMTNLNYIVGQELRPDEILNKLRKAIITSLRQKDESIITQMAEKGDAPIVTEKKDRSQDGMDVAMYVINEKEMTLSFAGANNPLVLIRDGEVQVIKASKMPVGIYAKLDPFERVDMELKKGDCLYTFSDGFQDQFGHETGRKFMSKHLREVLLANHQKPMAEQKEILNKTYEDWRGPADLQTDDVVLMGVRI